MAGAVSAGFELDPVTLEIAWGRLQGITDEAEITLVRTSFSPIIREAFDFAVMLMDGEGGAVTQSQRSMPSYTNGASVNRLPPPARVSSACGVAPMLNTLSVPVITTARTRSSSAMRANASSRPRIMSSVNMLLPLAERIVSTAIPGSRTRRSTPSPPGATGSSCEYDDRSGEVSLLDSCRNAGPDIFPA